MQKFLIVFSVFAVILSLASAQVPFPGRCPKVKVQQNFDVNRYLGLWFEYKKYFAIFEVGGSCITATYSDEGNDIIGVNNRQYSTLLKRYNSIMGNAVSVSNSGEAKLSVSFPNSIANPLASRGGSNYWVLSTDYTHYSVVWSCTDLLFFNLQFAWVLTRDQIPDANIIEKADEVFKDNGLSLTALSLTIQKNCSRSDGEQGFIRNQA